MSDIQAQLNDLTIAVGQTMAGINDIKKLQSDVVDLLRAHDRTDGRVDNLAIIVDSHEKQLKILTKERIEVAAKRDHINYWLKNWRNIATAIVAILAAGLVIYPKAVSFIKDIPVA